MNKCLILILILLCSCKSDNDFKDKIRDKIYQKNDYEGAIIDLKNHLQPNSIDNEIFTLYYDLGYCYYCLDKYELALENYNKYFELKKDTYSYLDEVAYHDRGGVKYHLGDYKGSLIDLNASIKLNPEDPSSYFPRAKSRFKLGLKKEACDDLNYYQNEETELDKEFDTFYNDCGCKN